MNLTFITGNAAKAEYLSIYFKHPVDHQKIDLPEIQSLDLEAIVKDKATRAFAEVGSPVLVEDVALTFNSLAPLPGPLVKWFLESLGNDGLCTLAHKYADHAAIASVVFCHYDGTTHHFFKGEVSGTISPEPRGDKNFGWDPIFIPDGSDQTWSEMSPDQKDATSMRRPALDALSTFLKNVQ